MKTMALGVDPHKLSRLSEFVITQIKQNKFQSVFDIDSRDGAMEALARIWVKESGRKVKAEKLYKAFLFLLLMFRTKDEVYVFWKDPDRNPGLVKEILQNQDFSIETVIDQLEKLGKNFWADHVRSKRNPAQAESEGTSGAQQSEGDLWYGQGLSHTRPARSELRSGISKQSKAFELLNDLMALEGYADMYFDTEPEAAREQVTDAIISEAQKMEFEEQILFWNKVFDRLTALDWSSVESVQKALHLKRILERVKYEIDPQDYLQTIMKLLEILKQLEQIKVTTGWRRQFTDETGNLKGLFSSLLEELASAIKMNEITKAFKMNWEFYGHQGDKENALSDMVAHPLAILLVREFLGFAQQQVVDGVRHLFVITSPGHKSTDGDIEKIRGILANGDLSGEQMIEMLEKFKALREKEYERSEASQKKDQGSLPPEEGDLWLSDPARSEVRISVRTAQQDIQNVMRRLKNTEELNHLILSPQFDSLILNLPRKWRSRGWTRSGESFADARAVVLEIRQSLWSADDFSETLKLWEKSTEVSDTAINQLIGRLNQSFVQLSKSASKNNLSLLLSFNHEDQETLRSVLSNEMRSLLNFLVILHEPGQPLKLNQWNDFLLITQKLDAKNPEAAIEAVRRKSLGKLALWETNGTFKTPPGQMVSVMTKAGLVPERLRKAYLMSSAAVLTALALLKEEEQARVLKSPEALKSFFDNHPYFNFLSSSIELGKNGSVQLNTEKFITFLKTRQFISQAA